MMHLQPGLFVLKHSGDAIGVTNLESGDPDEHYVSGVFNNLGGAKALANWIASEGGDKDAGAAFIELGDDFELQTRDGDAIAFEGGTLIAVEAEEEAFLEITGLSAADYEKYFAQHIAALDN
jgi:hypothetical protein